MSSIVVAGDTSGSVTLAAPAVAGSPTLTLPSSVGTGAQLLTTDGTGVMSWGSNVALFGTGADGAVTISSGTTTLVRDMHYSSLTISGTGKIYTAGWTIYVSGTLDLTAAGAQALGFYGTGGNNASGAAAGSFGISYQGLTAPSGHNGASGPNGSTGAGTNQSAITVNYAFGGKGGDGGSGGSALGGVTLGGTGAAATIGNRLATWPNAGQMKQVLGFPVPSSTGTGTLNGIWASMSGGPPGAGAGDGTNSGGGAGGSGFSGGCVSIYAAVINRGASTAVGAISVTGGSGFTGGTPAAGNAGGGGGGSGSGGGFVNIVAGALIGSTATNAIDLSGGTGGSGGNGVGTGTGGSGGGGGGSGTYQTLVLSPASFTSLGTSTAGSAGGAASGTTGGSGGSGATVRANL